MKHFISFFPLPKKKSDYPFSITAKVVDNNTGKKADIFMEGTDPEKLAGALAKFVEASCTLVNLNEEDLAEVKKQMELKLAEEKFECYEIHRPNIPADGCKKQCEACKEKQQNLKKS